MTAKSKVMNPKGDAFEAIHSGAAGLHQVGAIDKKTMREYDKICLTEVAEYCAKDELRIRKKATNDGHTN